MHYAPTKATSLAASFSGMLFPMRLLIVTQAVDRADPILGFFHRWIEGFASRVEHVSVIGQRVGEYSLPPNVSVHSLGKERGLSRWRQTILFWRLLWRHRHEYDAVFVHMVPLWVVLGGPLWLFRGTPVYL